MFPEMRRHRQALDYSECMEILEQTDFGVLAVTGINEYPYTVMLNHLCLNGRIYFHSAATGHKIEAISRDDRVCFCVAAEATVKAETLSTRFRSVDVFGRARLIEDEDKKREVLIALAKRYAPDFMEKAHEEIRTDLARTAIIELTPEHITGKISGDIMRERAAR